MEELLLEEPEQPAEEVVPDILWEPDSWNLSAGEWAGEPSEEESLLWEDEPFSQEPGEVLSEDGEAWEPGPDQEPILLFEAEGVPGPGADPEPGPDLEPYLSQLQNRSQNQVHSQARSQRLLLLKKILTIRPF